MARIFGIAGLLAYNWWVLVPFRPGLMRSPSELFSNLEVTGQPFATAMQHADLLSGLFLLGSFLAAGSRSIPGGRRDWLAMMVFAAAGALGGLSPEVCADEISARCRTMEWDFQLPLHQYLHIAAGILEFGGITVALLFACQRTRNERALTTRVYRDLARAAAVAYPLLGAAYLLNRLGGVVEAVFFTGFTVMAATQILERTNSLRRNSLNGSEDVAGSSAGPSAVACAAGRGSDGSMATGMRAASVRMGEGESPPRRWLALAVLCVSLLMVNLDNTVLNVALPTLVRDLHASSSQLQWIVDAYIMVFAGLVLVAGSLADRVGRKRTFLAGLAAFAVGSAWAAFSGSVGVLIAARASMGIGAALMMPSTLSIITDIFRDGGERQRAISLWAGTIGVGIALGPIVGGLLLTHFWWGSVFLINVPIAAVGVACAIPLVPDSKNPAVLGPDVAGAVLSITGLGLLLWSIIEAPLRGWSSAPVLSAGLAGLAVLAVFIVWERTTSHPMLRPRLFRSRRFSAAISSAALVMFGLFGALFIMTQFLQFDLGYTPLQAGVRILPAAGALAVIAPLSSALVRLAGTKLAVAAGLLCIAAGLWQTSGMSVTSTYTDIVPGMILLGLGAGLVIPAATESVMGSLPRGDTGVGSATNGALMQVGGALGVAVIGSLLSTRYQDRLTTSMAGYHVPHAVSTTILGSLGGALGVAAHLGGTLGALLAHLARSAFISGADLGVRTGAAVAVVGCLLALAALPARPPDDSDPVPDTPASTMRSGLPGRGSRGAKSS
jgi:EmrB/QacA subfamily drug resistance transporter